MKKVRNRFIKNLRYLCLIGVVALGLITIVATGGGDGGGAPPSPPGTAPTISNVVIYDVNWIPSLSFDIGDYANFEVYATDLDLDMVNCYITQYYPHDATTPYYGPSLMSLPSQSAPDMIYYNIDPIQITGPAGDWRIDFQIEDSRGNESNVFTVYTIIGGSLDPLLSKTLLLKGYWHFYYTIISTWHEYYTLDTIPGDTNAQGGYYIYGTDEYGDLVIAAYWPDDGNWSLLDPGIIIDKFYYFYTDGGTILSNSCYYQIEISTGDWSACYTLYGDKVSSILTSQVKRSLMEAIDAEEIRLIEGEAETVNDSIKQKYWQLKEAIDSQK